MAGKKHAEKQAALEEINQQIHIISAPAARNPAQMQLVEKVKAKLQKGQKEMEL